MIYQNDPRLPAPIHFYGCYLLSLCERISNSFGLFFDERLVLNTLTKGQAEGWIDFQITLMQPQKICDYIAGSGKVLFMGKYPASYFSQDNEKEICCWHKEGASFNHFVSGNGRGVVVYDPWNEHGSDSVKNGTLISKRIYRIL